MNNLNVFSNDEFGEINVIVINNKEYFEAIPIAKMLGYSNPRAAILRHCIEGGVLFRDVGVANGINIDNTKRIQYVDKKFIDEGNLYRLIIKSKLPNALRFEKWVMDEVLPTIRKHGSYMKEEVMDKTLDDPDFIIELATKLKKEKYEKILAQQEADALEAMIAIDKPYTDFGKSISASSDAITIGQFARLLRNHNITIGRNRLFDYLRENGYLIKSGKEKNMPKQVYVERGLFAVAEKVINTVNGEILSTTTLITGKGQLYFLKLIIYKRLVYNRSGLTGESII